MISVETTCRNTIWKERRGRLTDFFLRYIYYVNHISLLQTLISEAGIIWGKTSRSLVNLSLLEKALFVALLRFWVDKAMICQSTFCCLWKYGIHLATGGRRKTATVEEGNGGCRIQCRYIATPCKLSQVTQEDTGLATFLVIVDYHR